MTDDIAGLNLSGLSYKNNASGGVSTLGLLQDITLSGPVVMDSTVTTTSVMIERDISAVSGHTITLGADVTITADAKGFQLGNASTNDTLALNGHTLTVNQSVNANQSDALWTNITGSGNLTLNLGPNQLDFYGTNTYSGTTQLNSGTFTGDPTMFGSSSVAVANGADVTYSSATNVTINNAFSIAGVANGSRLTSLFFQDVSGTAGSVTYTVPNITLNGNTRFASLGSPTINLAGIQSNGHCIEYLGKATSGVLDGPSNGFLNGPNGCQLAATSSSNTVNPTATAPKTPNTGFKLVSANPVGTLAVSLLAMSTLAGLAFRVRATSSKR